MAAALLKESETEVETVNGGKGELAVLVDGREVAQKKGESLPEVDDVVAAVRKAHPVGAGA